MRITTKAWATALFTLCLAVGLTGCFGPSAEERRAEMEPVLLSVPGVTGGSLRVTNAELSNIYTCPLTTDATDETEMRSILTDVLVTFAETSTDTDGSGVRCSLTNGSVTIRPTDLGLTQWSSIREIRELLG